jgi:hypothetical protein
VPNWEIEINGSPVTGYVKEIKEELGGQDEVIVVIANDSTNRAIVANDYTLDIIFNSVTIWTGYVYGHYSQKDGTIEVIGYRREFKELEESTLTADYSAGETAANIIQAAAAEAGIGYGTAPGTSIKVRFIAANCLDVVKYVADVCETDYYRASNQISVGARGSNKGTISNIIIDKTKRGIDRAKVRNHVIVRGFDADNLAIIGQAYWDAPNTTIVKGTDPPGGFDKKTHSFSDRKGQDAATLDSVAASALEKLRREDAGSLVNTYIDEAYNVYPGDDVVVNDTELGFSGTYEVFKTVKNIWRVSLHIERETEALDKQIDKTRKYEELGIYHVSTHVDDLNETIPSAPSGFDASDITTGTYVANDGTVHAYFIVDIPRVTLDTYSYGLRWRRSGASDWEVAYIEQPTSGNAVYRIDQVEPGATYEFQVCAVGRLGGQSDWVPDPTPVQQTASSDTSAPATPTGFNAADAVMGWELNWTPNTEDDLDHYIIYKNTVNNSGTASIIARTRNNYIYIQADTAEYGLVRYFWIKAVDTSGNESGFSTMSSATALQIDTVDIAPNAIEAAQILNDAITGDKLKEGIQPFNTNITFSPRSGNEHDQVNYTSGTIRFLDGGTHAITGNNLSISTATGIWYIYFDTDSASLIQTQTYSDVIADDRGLLAIVEHSTDSTQEVMIQPFYSKGLNIQADVIAAQAIATEHLQAWSVTAGKIVSLQINLTDFTWSNNSPSGGYIAWTAGNVHYNGTTYAISGSNTNNDYVYWNVGDSTFTKSNTKPDWTSTRFMIAINDPAGYYKLIWNTTLIHGGTLITGTVTTQELAAQSVTAEKMNTSLLVVGGTAYHVELHLPLDGNADDFSDNDINTTQVGGAWSSYGAHGGAYIAYGTGGNDHILVDAHSEISAYASESGGFTVSCWVYVASDGEGNYGRICDKQGGGYRFYVQNESAGAVDLAASVDMTTDATSVTSGRPLPLNTWTHVAFRFNFTGSHEIDIFVNGIDMPLGTDTAGTGSMLDDRTNDLWIADRSADDRCFDGRIDDFVFQGRAQNNNKMMALYREGMTLRSVITNKMITTEQIIAKDFRTALDVGVSGGPAGVRMSSAGIYGYSGGTTEQFYLRASDGKALAGGGAVTLDNGGVTINWVSSIATLEFTYSNSQRSYFYAGSAGSWWRATNNYDIELYASGTGTISMLANATTGEIQTWGTVFHSQANTHYFTGLDASIGWNVNQWMSWSMPNILHATEAKAITPAATACKISYLIVRVYTNSLNGTCVVNAEVNWTTSSLYESIASGVTGTQTEKATEVAVSNLQVMSCGINTTGSTSGEINLPSIQIRSG